MQMGSIEGAAADGELRVDKWHVCMCLCSCVCV